MEKDLIEYSHKSHLSKYWIYYFFIMLEVSMIILFSIFVQYGNEGNARHADNYNTSADIHFTQSWHVFQDVNVMIFVGFGFLVSYLNKFNWSGIVISFCLAAWTIQLALLTQGWWYAVFSGDWANKISLNVSNFLQAQYTAGSVLVALGAVIGKLSLAQYIVMATIITLTQPIVWHTTNVIFISNDYGGGMNVFLYGAVFGLCVAIIVKKQDSRNSQNHIYRNSGLFTFIGTLFLFVFWPSWNAAFVTGNRCLRAHMNTILSLTGSCVISFFVSILLSDRKFCLKHILFGTISGGVIMGSVADTIVYPWASFFIGCCSGALTVSGLKYITPLMNKSLFQDSIGVLFIYGIPGFLSGILSAIFAGTASVIFYGKKHIYNIYPLWDTRTREYIAGYQLGVIAIVISLATVVGFLTGALLNFTCFENIKKLFNDKEIFSIDNIVDENFEIKKKNVVPLVEMATFSPMRFKQTQNLEKDSEIQNLNEHQPMTPTLDLTEKREIKENSEEHEEEVPKQIQQIEIHLNSIE